MLFESVFYYDWDNLFQSFTKDYKNATQRKARIPAHNWKVLHHFQLDKVFLFAAAVLYAFKTLCTIEILLPAIRKSCVVVVETH